MTSKKSAKGARTGRSATTPKAIKTAQTRVVPPKTSGRRGNR